MRFIILFFMLIYSFTARTQTASGNLETYIGDVISNSPDGGGDNFIAPTTTQLNNWDELINYLLSNDLVNARNSASALNYQVTEFTDNTISSNNIFYILEEMSPQSYYWGTYVFSAAPKSGNLIIQAPHAKYDSNTGLQAAHCFKNNVARALFINGTHRCNSSNFSSCSGTTGVCDGGTSNPFRLTDMAHNDVTMFQKTTENLFSNIPSSVFIQLHGFGWDTGEPYVIISNGTRETPKIDYATQIKDALFIEDNSLTFELPHINLNWNSLIGFTNTQGRAINYAVNQCSSSAEGTSGRFIHIEQERTKLRANATVWPKMSNALASVFVEDADGDGIDSVTDTDDNDSCVPNLFAENCGLCTAIIFDNFDTALGNWSDGGANCVYTTHNAIGDKSLRLRYNTASSITYSDPLDLSSYTDLKVEFSFFSVAMLNGDLFALEISTDGGSNFSTQQVWTYTTDFDNDIRYFEYVPIAATSFTDNTVFRFRGQSSNTSNSDSGIHIDHVTIKSCKVDPTLPIELVSFNAKFYSEYQYVGLDWTSLMEEDNDFFVIEKSLNGIEWEDLERIDGQGTTTETHNYFFIDDKVINGATYYYRLKAVDFERTLKYSLIRAVKIDGEPNTTVRVHPNPIRKGERLNFGNQDKIGRISLFSLLGTEFSIENLINNPIPSDLPSGVYLLKIELKSGDLEFKKIIIH